MDPEISNSNNPVTDNNSNAEPLKPTPEKPEQQSLESPAPNQSQSFFSISQAMNTKVPVSIVVLILTVVITTIGISFIVLKSTTLSYNITLQGPDGQKTDFIYGEQPALSNPDFFDQVKKQFIVSKASFIEANLSSMIMRVYQNGEQVLEVPIVTKGRKGSWWETPAGLYKINVKEKAHFSGMGHVWMPWSMNFQGNFYIHGRTYYPDGTLTSAQYTGGCIRLSTEDTEKVYNLVSVGTPLLVFEQNFSSDGFSYKSPLELGAPVYLSADLRNNHVFINKDSTKQVPIASLTKLMTALITTEYINLDNKATVPQEGLVYTSKPRLKVGEEYSIYQLLFPLLMESSNEAAETIARYYGRQAFIKHMNNKAASIGMSHTVFADPSGASAENISTAEDLFMLAKYIYNNRSFIFRITSGKIKDSAYGTVDSSITNINDFVDREYFFGGKNGKTTAANETNLSVFEFPVNGSKRPIATIVLGSSDEKSDAEKLIEFTFNILRR